MEHYQGRSSITLDEDFELPGLPPGTVRLDLACGQQKRKGFIGVDNSSGFEYDYISTVDGKITPECLSKERMVRWDLTQYPWPFENNTVFEANCSHYIEHVKDLEMFMKELYRIMCPLGIVAIAGPYYTSIRASQDYTHVRSLNEMTMKYFDQEWLKTASLDKIYTHGVDFESINTIFIYTNEWASKSEEAKMWALKHYWNVAEDIIYVLRKRG